MECQHPPERPAERRDSRFQLSSSHHGLLLSPLLVVQHSLFTSRIDATAGGTPGTPVRTTDGGRDLTCPK